MNIKKDFTLLENNPGMIYADSSCMSLRPKVVVDKLIEYYNLYPVCAGRSAHSLSIKLNDEIYVARHSVRKFINARDDREIIFTRNTTEGINLIANSFKFNDGDAVLITEKEHNSNLVPWIKLKEKGIELLVLKLNDDGTFNMDLFDEMLSSHSNIRLVSFHHISNIDGVELPIAEVIKKSHLKDIKVLVDAAQSAPHMELNVKKLDVDFLVFSGHKMMGPSGSGVLYGKTTELLSLRPFLVGGDTVKDTTYDSVVYEDLPMLFEAGLQDYSGIVALGSACNYLRKLGLSKIHKHEIMLNEILTSELADLVTIIGPKDSSLRGGVFNFYIEGIDMHNFSMILDSSSKIMTRSGQHCVHSYYNEKKLPVTSRVSFYAYNTREDALKIVTEIKNLIELLK